jgi:hypothetical protein
MGTAHSTIAKSHPTSLLVTRRIYAPHRLIYTTGHGRGDFTVPQFDRYLRRSYELAPPAPRR